MKNYFDDDEEEGGDYPDEGDLGRVFDMRDLFQGEDAIAIEFQTYINTNRMILDTVLRILEKSFWWRFRSHKSKLATLIATYRAIRELLVDMDEDDPLDLSVEESEE